MSAAEMPSGRFETRTDSPAPMPTARVGLAVAAMALVFAALLFGPAGQLDWTLPRPGH